ncbi:MAG: sulfite exporter TauE/SafE family protein [Planctomycetota bacterium]
MAMAVLFASLLGSLHCVGMCGPFAIWAAETSSRSTAMVAYHAGRLMTYASAGLMAGLLGTALSLGGEMAGFQFAAAKLAGVVLIAAGLLRILGCIPWFRSDPTPAASVVNGPTTVARLLAHAKPALASRGAIGRGFLTGLLTTWLPCGWLYLFVLTAAGTGRIASAMVVMVAFWLGTLPALTSVAMGAGVLWRRFPGFIPAVAGVVLVLAGIVTATGRASADLTTLTRPSVGSLKDMANQPLPCCEPLPP